MNNIKINKMTEDNKKLLEDFKSKMANKEDLKAFEKSLENINEDIENIKNMFEGGKIQKKDNDAFKSWLEANIDEINNIKSRGSGILEFDPEKHFTKDEPIVGRITTGSGTLNTPPNTVGTDLAQLSNINYASIDITNITTNVVSSTSTYSYTEAKPRAGAPEFTAEGGTYKEIDMEWITSHATTKKVTAFQRLTDEAIEDVANLQNVAQTSLFDRVMLKRNKTYIWLGDGTNNTPKSMTSYGKPFTAGSFADKFADADIRDVLTVCKRRISLTHNFENEVSAVANYAIVSPEDFCLEVESKKEKNTGRPMYPDVNLNGTITLNGVTLIPIEGFPSGKILVGDLIKYNTSNYSPYKVQIGYVNDDFIKGQFVMTGTVRGHAFVKSHDEVAFIFDDIANIKKAIDPNIPINFTNK